MEETAKTDTIRDEPQLSDADANLLKVWAARIDSAKTHWKDRFKKMKEDQVLARLGCDENWYKDGNYRVPIIRRQINQAVATIYAKNPTFKVEPRKRLRYKIWDGTMAQLQAAQMMLPEPMAAQAIIAEVTEVQAQEAMLKKVAKTAELLLAYYLNEQDPNFKTQMKMLVRRSKTVGVGYVWLDFQRLFEKRAEIQSQIDDITSKLSLVERESADVNDGVAQEDSADAAELKNNLADLEKQVDIVVREGLVFDFLRGNEVLVDPRCKQLKGFVGARWVARLVHMPVEDVQESYKVDLRKAGYKVYAEDGKEGRPMRESTDPENAQDVGGEIASVWIIYDKKARQRMVYCEGYKGWLEAPKAPDIETEHFWPAFPLVFNEVDDEKEVIPPSYVSDMKDAQLEYNRTRQGLREHRIANRPFYVAPKGSLSQEDRDKLQNRPANGIAELNAVAPGQSVDTVLQAVKPAPIDPNVYNTGEAIEDINRGAGSQDATTGVASSGATATESAIADASRTKADTSDIDDIDEFMTAVGRAAVQILLLHLTPETAIKIAGPGAVWPQIDRATAVEELDLEIKAGSSGRPNAAAKMANMERAWPIVSQLPGINPEPVATEVGDLLDLDMEQLYTSGMPSIVAMNAMMKPQGAGPGGPVTSDDPNQQGDQGADNAEQPEGATPGGQPEMPAGKVVQFDNQGRRMVA